MTKVAKQDGKYYEIAKGTGVFIEIDKDEYDKLRKDGATISTQKFSAGGEVLKPIPEDNKGLPNLPKEVRNKMGYMKDGGMVNKNKKSKVAGRLAKRGYGKVMKGKK